jgi:hypothetical protein
LVFDLKDLGSSDQTDKQVPKTLLPKFFLIRILIKEVQRRLNTSRLFLIPEKGKRASAAVRSSERHKA